MPVELRAIALISKGWDVVLVLAVRVGFEPTEPVKVQRFSRPPDSTTLAPHRSLHPTIRAAADAAPPYAAQLTTYVRQQASRISAYSERPRQPSARHSSRLSWSAGPESPAPRHSPGTEGGPRPKPSLHLGAGIGHSAPCIGCGCLCKCPRK